MPACVIPLPLEQQPDGGGGRSRPVIRKDLTRPDFPKFTLRQGQSQDFNIGLADSDEQTLYIRMFLQGRNGQHGIYDRYLPIAPSSVGGSGVRAIGFTFKGLCDEYVDNVIEDYILELYVADAPFVDSGTDLRLISTASGSSATDYWVMSCRSAITDGGP